MSAMRTLAAALFSIGALSTLSSINTAQAADIKIYGRIDTGLVYQHFSGDSTKEDSFSLDSGPNTASRWGVQGSEQITPETSVGFRLENRFASDTGELKENGRMFGGMAAVTISNKTWGELAFGRMAGVGSGSGPYDLLILIDAFDGGSVGTGVTSVRSTRYDNMITYRSPMIAGLQATLQYSLNTDSTGEDQGDESTSDVNRFYAAALRYNAGPLNIVGYYEGTAWGHVRQPDNGADTDKQVFTLGASYRFEPVTVYAQAQYYNGVNKMDGFTADDRASSIKGYGLYAGAQFWFGLSSWQSMVYWRDYTRDGAEGAPSWDGKTIAVATKYLYRPSKTIDMYVGGGFSQWDRISDGKVLTDKGFNVFSGITKYF